MAKSPALNGTQQGSAHASFPSLEFWWIKLKFCTLWNAEESQCQAFLGYTAGELWLCSYQSHFIFLSILILKDSKLILNNMSSFFFWVSASQLFSPVHHQILLFSGHSPPRRCAQSQALPKTPDLPGQSLCVVQGKLLAQLYLLTDMNMLVGVLCSG